MKIFLQDKFKSVSIKKNIKIIYLKVTTGFHMNEKDVQDIFIISTTFASGKRLLLLFILQNEPMGYTLITKWFERMGIPIGSSEVYKHLNLLLEHGFISKRGNSYVLTLKGLRAVESTVEIISTPPKTPELRLSFKGEKD